jgi:hypothetical protein
VAGGRPRWPVSPPRGGAAARGGAAIRRKGKESGGERGAEAAAGAREAGGGRREAPARAAAARAAGELGRGGGRSRGRRPLRSGGRSSPMAEGRRREDEEEELRERRELGGPRRARGRAISGHPAAGEGHLGSPRGWPEWDEDGRGGEGEVGTEDRALSKATGRWQSPHQPGGDPHLPLLLPRAVALPSLSSLGAELGKCEWLLVALEHKLHISRANYSRSCWLGTPPGGHLSRVTRPLGHLSGFPGTTTSPLLRAPPAPQQVQPRAV